MQHCKCNVVPIILLPHIASPYLCGHCHMRNVLYHAPDVQPWFIHLVVMAHVEMIPFPVRVSQPYTKNVHVRCGTIGTCDCILCHCIVSIPVTVNSCIQNADASRFTLYHDLLVLFPTKNSKLWQVYADLVRYRHLSNYHSKTALYRPTHSHVQGTWTKFVASIAWHQVHART